MARAIFSKTGTAVWISHLDLMRVIQRAFRRCGLLLAHSQGYSPHPILSLATPLSVGVSSDYELMDFALAEGSETPPEALPALLNDKLPEGIRVLECYAEGRKIRELKWLEAALTLEYDRGVPTGAAEAVEALFQQDRLVVEKHSKKGPVETDLIPMIRTLAVKQTAPTQLRLTATVSAQNPTCNPLLLVSAIEKEFPELAPDFAGCHRLGFYDEAMKLFR